MSKDALTLFREGNPEEALNLLESLAVRHPKDPGQPIPKGLPIMQPGELISDFNNGSGSTRATRCCAHACRLCQLGLAGSVCCAALCLNGWPRPAESESR